MFTVYRITNKINGLIYVGCTTQKLNKRISQHFINNNRNDDFHKAIREFGKDSFTVEILESDENKPRKDGLEREKYWIAYYNSNNPSIGYNRTVGGSGTIGYIFTDEAKRKISEAMTGRPVSEKTLEAMRNNWKGKHLPLEMRKKISETRKGKYTGENNPFYGKHHTEATKNKIRNAHSKPVIGCSIETNAEIYFSSLTNAAKYSQNNRGGIVSTIKSHIGNSIREINCKTAYGYKWRYAEKSNDYPDRE